MNLSQSELIIFKQLTDEVLRISPLIRDAIGVANFAILETRNKDAKELIARLEQNKSTVTDWID